PAAQVRCGRGSRGLHEVHVAVGGEEGFAFLLAALGAGNPHTDPQQDGEVDADGDEIQRVQGGHLVLVAGQESAMRASSQASLNMKPRQRYRNRFPRGHRMRASAVPEVELLIQRLALPMIFNSRSQTPAETT